MNILLVSYYQIYPITGGSSIAQFGVIEYLSNICNISLLIPEEFTPSDEELTELKNLLPKVRIYTFKSKVDLTKNSINYGSSCQPNSNPLDYLKLLFYKIKGFIKKNLIKQKEPQKTPVPFYSPEDEFIDFYSINPYFIHNKEYITKINDILVKDAIDIVQLEFDENLNIVSALPKHVKKVFVEHECRFSRIESHIKTKNIEFLFGNYVYEFFKCIELALLEKFDGIITFHEEDKLLLQDALITKKNLPEMFVSPFPVLDVDFRSLNIENFSKLDKLVFVGAGEHFPNKDGLEWFLEEVAVEILQKFGLKLYVVGEWSLGTIKKYESHPSEVHFTGFIKDLYEVMKNSISIAPMRIGGGLRSKILLSMAQGIPVISTGYSLKGISAKHLESVMVADDKDSFCWSVDYLLSDIERTFLICQNAQNLVKANYSQSVISQQRYNFYNHLIYKKNENFTQK